MSSKVDTSKDCAKVVAPCAPKFDKSTTRAKRKKSPVDDTDTKKNKKAATDSDIDENLDTDNLSDTVALSDAGDSTVEHYVPDAGDSHDEDNAGDCEGSTAEDSNQKCPFTDAEFESIKDLLNKQFEREKEEASCDGQITCLWTGRRCCYCNCGPHLMCMEHKFNCIMGSWDGGKPNIPKGVDPLLKRWMLWFFGTNLNL